MKVSGREVHSLAQLAGLMRMLYHPGSGTTDGLFLATQLVMHGRIAESNALIHTLQRNASSASARVYLDHLMAMAGEIGRLPGLAEACSDQQLLSRLYQTEGYQFFPGSLRREKLLIIFTTMYNNFQIANIVLYVFLKNIGVSVLFVRDDTFYVYLRGVKGIGSSFASIVEFVQELVSRNGIDEVFTTGFSSAGYASLLLSTMIPTRRYTGFSVVADLSDDLPYSAYHTQAEILRRQLPGSGFRNLRDVIAERPDGVQRTLYFGAQSPVDVMQATKLAGLPDIDLRRLPDCGHHVIRHLVAAGTFFGILEQMLA